MESVREGVWRVMWCGRVWPFCFLSFPCLFPLMKATLQSFIEQWGAFVSTLLQFCVFFFFHFFTKSFILSPPPNRTQPKPKLFTLVPSSLSLLPLLHSFFRYCSVVLTTKGQLFTIIFEKGQIPAWKYYIFHVLPLATISLISRFTFNYISLTFDLLSHPSISFQQTNICLYVLFIKVSFRC